MDDSGERNLSAGRGISYTSQKNEEEETASTNCQETSPIALAKSQQECVGPCHSPLPAVVFLASTIYLETRVDWATEVPNNFKLVRTLLTAQMNDL